MKKIGQIANLIKDLSEKGKIKTRLLRIWFSINTDMASEIGEEVKQQVATLASKRLFDDVRRKAKNPRLKTRAEILADVFKICLLPK